MRAEPNFAIEKQLIRDTFQQARATGVMWIMLAVTGICTALCLSVNVTGDVLLRDKDDPGYFLPAFSPQSDAKAQREGVETIRGRMTLAFGAVSFPLGRDRSDAVLFVELLLAWAVAGTFGVLLALVWTAGFMPTFLDPRAVSVLLAKPIARWRLLLAKYLGVVTFLGFQIVLFVVLTWFALGVAHRRLGHDLLVLHSSSIAAVCGLLQFLGAAGGAHAQHGGVRLRLPALLAAGPGYQLWQRDGVRHAGRPISAAGNAHPGRGGVLDFPQAH